MKITIDFDIEKIKKYAKKIQKYGVPLYFGPVSGFKGWPSKFDESDWQIEFVEFFEKLSDFVEFFAEEEYWRKQKKNTLAKRLTIERDNSLKNKRFVSYKLVGGKVKNTCWKKI